MEDQLITLLTQTQSSEASPRNAAEQQLQQHYTDESFPIGLASIASHDSVALETRQAALLVLKNYVLASWSPELDEYQGQILLGEETKGRLRETLLQLATSETAPRKVQSAASYVVSKIAFADFPDSWPNLLHSLLDIIPKAADTQVHGALKVLANLVEEGFEESELFSNAQHLANVIYNVAANDARAPVLKALAVSIFVPLLESLELLQQDHGAAVKSFAEQTLTGCLPIFLDILKAPLPARMTATSGTSADEGSNDNYNGLVALKIQVAKVIVKVRLLFPSLIAPVSLELFTAAWQELSSLQVAYQSTYVEADVEGRLEDSDGLPYTLDFLVLEELDFLQSLIRAPPVRKELEKQLQDQQQSNWLRDMTRLIICFAQITTEEEGMWDIDVNVFLAEETNVTTNYTPRTACGDLMIKIGEWIKVAFIDAFLQQLHELHSSGASWKLQESALFILNQVITDWFDLDNKLDTSITTRLLEFTKQAQQASDAFLRARGYLASGTLLKISLGGVGIDVSEMVRTALGSITGDSSEIVQVSCIRALQYYLQTMPRDHAKELQSSMLQSMESWLASQDVHDLSEGDDLLVTVVETLRDIIMLDTSICIHGSGLNMLFTVASGNASNFQMITLVAETFEDICKEMQTGGAEAYTQLCERVLPSLIGAFDIGDLTEENALTSLAAELLSILAKYGSKPLPNGFVDTVMPKLNRLLLNSQEEDLLRACTITTKYMLSHDAEQVFRWHDASNSKTGLESLLVIIDRLLGPSVDDAAAAEVGGLASEVVEKAGSDRLGPYLMQLLQAVARRVATAEQTHLVQSLISVFARLSLASPGEILDFLTELSIGDQTGLTVVMEKWTDNANFFAGYEDIRQTTMALAKLYSLHDQRLEQINVKGDIIATQGDRIMTRSKAKQNPDQYTMIPVPVKIIKLLVEELTIGNAANGLDGVGAQNALEEADGEEDEDWEDEPGAFDNFAGTGASKAELMAFAEENPMASRQVDDETQHFLGDFFRSIAQEPGFEVIFNALTPAEQDKLRSLS